MYCCRPAFCAADVSALSVTLPKRYHPSIELPIRVQLEKEDSSLFGMPWDGEVSITCEGDGAAITPDTITLYNGVGSGFFSLEGESAITLTFALDDITTEIILEPLAWQTHAVSEDPEVPASWGPEDGIIHVTGDITINKGDDPETPSLTIREGTVIIIDPEVSLRAEGAIACLGSASRPVLITSSADDPWGEIYHRGEDAPYPESQYAYTFFCKGGDSDSAGHTGKGPVVRIKAADVTFRSCCLADNYGKCIWAESSGSLTMEDSLLARSAMGMEVSDIDMLLEETHFLEFIGEDDNDGLYMHEGGEMEVRNCIFARGTDEGIDTLGSTPLIESCIIRGYKDKGISAFYGTTTVRRCLITDCHDPEDGEAGKGISAKGDGTVVNIENCTLYGNDISFQTRIKQGNPDDNVCMNIVNTIAWGAQVGVDSEYDLEYFNVTISYSDVAGPFVPYPDETVYPGEGNIITDPLFENTGEHDFRLAENSPCIDAGSPDADPDPDQTRCDMGLLPFFQAGPPPQEFIRGDANTDGAGDLSDAITILLYLFADHTILCEDAADVNDDGTIDISDAVSYLYWLFAGGAVTPAPFPECGTDPTEDELDCSSFAPCAP